MQRIFKISKRHFQKPALAEQKEMQHVHKINFGNDKTQTEKSLIPTQKPVLTMNTTMGGRF